MNEVLGPGPSSQPTATQCVGVAHDTLRSQTFDVLVGLGLGRMVQVVPSHNSVRV